MNNQEMKVKITELQNELKKIKNENESLINEIWELKDSLELD